MVRNMGIFITGVLAGFSLDKTGINFPKILENINENIEMSIFAVFSVLMMTLILWSSQKALKASRQ